MTSWQIRKRNISKLMILSYPSVFSLKTMTWLVFNPWLNRQPVLSTTQAEVPTVWQVLKYVFALLLVGGINVWDFIINHTRDWILQSATVQVCTAWPGPFVFTAQTPSANVSLKNQFSEESPHARHGLVHARRTSEIIWTWILQFYGTFINQQLQWNLDTVQL